MRIFTELKEYSKDNIWFCLLVLLIIVGIVLHHGLTRILSLRTAVELFFCLLIFGAFYYFFGRNNSRFNEYYRENSFYCKLMAVTLVGILLGNIHFLHSDEAIRQQLIKQGFSEPEIQQKIIEIELKSTVKVWEVAAYIVTAIYNIWFWFGSNAGKQIFDSLRNVSRNAIINIILMIVALALVAFLHIIVVLGNLDLLRIQLANRDFLQILFTGQFSIVLIVIVYILYFFIDKSVITHTEGRYQEDFRLMLIYIDKPILYIFIILTIYAGYTTLTGHFHSVEFFFSGAIAFELLLSSIVWANTKTA
jgi:hypothetical protein